MTTPLVFDRPVAEVAQLQKLTKDDLMGFQGAVFQRIVMIGKAALRLPESQHCSFSEIIACFWLSSVEWAYR